MEQLRQLLAHLDVQDRFDILGSSWGGMIGSRFASTRPAGLRRLILANAPASKNASIENRKKFRKMLPKEMQDVLDKVEKEGTWRSPEASVVMGEFARRHACNVFPFPEDLLTSFKLSREDQTVITAM